MDEIEFSNHDGYVFHDSCGFEAGSIQELAIVQNFVRQRSGERRLEDRLHAIWFAKRSRLRLSTVDGQITLTGTASQWITKDQSWT